MQTVLVWITFSSTKDFRNMKCNSAKLYRQTICCGRHFMICVYYVSCLIHSIRMWLFNYLLTIRIQKVLKNQLHLPMCGIGNKSLIHTAR